MGPDHPDVATTLNNLAVLYKSEGDLAAAGALFQRCLSLLEKTLGKDHPQTRACRENYGAARK